MLCNLNPPRHLALWLTHGRCSVLWVEWLMDWISESWLSEWVDNSSQVGCPQLLIYSSLFTHLLAPESLPKQTFYLPPSPTAHLICPSLCRPLLTRHDVMRTQGEWLSSGSLVDLSWPFLLHHLLVASLGDSALGLMRVVFIVYMISYVCIYIILHNIFLYKINC